MLPERILYCNQLGSFILSLFYYYIIETFVRINELKHGLEIKGLEKQGFRHKDLMTRPLLY